jgi:hypothetical protein
MPRHPIERHWWRSSATALLLAACGGGAGDRPASEVIVERETLAIAAGAVERIRADRLVVRDGAVIDGTLVVEPLAGAAGEAFTLVVERGDLVVRGAVQIDEPPAPAAARLRANTQRERATQVAPPAGQKTLEFEVPNGDIHLHSVSSFRAGRGADGATLVVTEPRDATAVDGASGGNIVFKTNVIHVHREEVIRADGSLILRGPHFNLGAGGKGGSIEVDDTAFPDAMPERLAFSAGHGGRSGRLLLLATEVRLPAVNGKIDARGWRLEHVLLGVGGWGGDVVWPVGDGHAFENLTEVVLRAGDGGSGAAVGGRGGRVSYRSGKAVSARALPRAFGVVAISGNGGDAQDELLDFGDESALAMYVDRGALDIGGRGGNGGPVQVWGNAGAAGDGDAIDAQAGGHVDIRFGHGGRTTSTAIYPFGRGGDGGGLQQADGEDDVLTERIGGGSGGDGASRCAVDTGAGGRGGDSGDITVRFGRGGDAVQPGDGGTLDYGRIRFPAVGRGGSGRPAGDNGTPGKVVFEVAAGGRHPADPSIVGASSIVVGVKVETVVAEPNSCGAAPDVPSGGWSEEFRHTETRIDAGVTKTSNRTETTSCTPQELPRNDPLDPVFRTMSCTWRSDSIALDGSTVVVDGRSQCLSVDADNAPHGQTTVRRVTVDARSGQTFESTQTTETNCPVSSKRFGGGSFCAQDPTSGEYTLVQSDGPTYRWGWSRINSAGNGNSVEYQYTCTNCAPRRNCRCDHEHAGYPSYGLVCEDGGG